MAIYAIIENNVVSNTIVADAAFISNQNLNAVDVSNMNPRPSKGISYVDGSFVFPENSTITLIKANKQLSSTQITAIIIKMNNYNPSVPFSAAELKVLSNETLTTDELATIPQ